jgi:hypothetical protein
MNPENVNRFIAGCGRYRPRANLLHKPPVLRNTGRPGHTRGRRLIRREHGAGQAIVARPASSDPSTGQLVAPTIPFRRALRRDRPLSTSPMKKIRKLDARRPVSRSNRA